MNMQMQPQNEYVPGRMYRADVYESRVDLTKHTEFDPTGLYWIKIADAKGGASLDYILANDVAPGALLFAPSCETAHFGCVKIQDKAHWEYRMKSNTSKVPEGHFQSQYRVIDIIERRYQRVN